MYYIQDQINKRFINEVVNLLIEDRKKRNLSMLQYSKQVLNVSYPTYYDLEINKKISSNFNKNYIIIANIIGINAVDLFYGLWGRFPSSVILKKYQNEIYKQEQLTEQHS